MSDVPPRQQQASNQPTPRSFMERRRRPVASLLSALSRVAPGVKPVAQKALIRMAYEMVSLWNRDADKLYMNYGYAAVDPTVEKLPLAPTDETNRLCIQLYHAVVSPVDLRDKDVLEVGCGRGGGASFIVRYFHPKRYVGVDLAARAVSLAKASHHFPGLSFETGDAENLQFPPATFDAVVNVESSHTYPSVPRFLTEVHRVLRPGGVFLFADLRPTDVVDELRGQVGATGFEVVEEELITENVVYALDLDDERHRAMIPRRAPRWLKEVAGEFLGVKNGGLYNALRTGELTYIRFVLRKPSPTTSQ